MHSRVEFCLPWGDGMNAHCHYIKRERVFTPSSWTEKGCWEGNTMSLFVPSAQTRFWTQPPPRSDFQAQTQMLSESGAQCLSGREGFTLLSLKPKTRAAPAQTQLSVMEDRTGKGAQGGVFVCVSVGRGIVGNDEQMGSHHQRVEPNMSSDTQDLETLTTL